MKSKALLIGVLAAAGLMVAAGVTVAAGEVVSRPIGLNGAPDDLGRSLVPDSGAGQTTTVRRTVKARKGKPASAGASEVPASPSPNSYGDGSGSSGEGSSGGSGGSSGGSGGGTGGQAKPAPPHEDSPAPSGEDQGDGEGHEDEGHDDD